MSKIPYSVVKNAMGTELINIRINILKTVSVNIISGVISQSSKRCNLSDNFDDSSLPHMKHKNITIPKSILFFVNGFDILFTREIAKPSSKLFS
jgi:hypothetical protein